MVRLTNTLAVVSIEKLLGFAVAFFGSVVHVCCVGVGVSGRCFRVSHGSIDCRCVCVCVCPGSGWGCGQFPKRVFFYITTHVVGVSLTRLSVRLPLQCSTETLR